MIQIIHTVRKNKKAFTLIELLVVIAIIAILAAILFPVFARARENARRAACQSNMKQIGIGILQYTQDYDECFPLGVTGSTSATSNPPVGWADSIQPYVKSTQLLQCPNDTTDPGANPTLAGYTDYWYNSNLSSAGNAVAPNNVAVKIAALANSTATIMVGDGIAANGAASYRCNGGTSTSLSDYNLVTNPASNSSSGFVSTGAVVTRHLEGTNLLFADGHVKWNKVSATGSSGTFRGVLYKATTSFTVSGSSPTFRVRE